jgi:hypothetical protein
VDICFNNADAARGGPHEEEPHPPPEKRKIRNVLRFN